MYVVYEYILRCLGGLYVKSRMPYSTCLGIKDMAENVWISFILKNRFVQILESDLREVFFSP